MKVSKIGLVAVAIAAFVATAAAYDVKAPAKGGKIKGKVTFTGDKGKVNKQLKVEKDPDMCGENMADPDVIVGDGDGLADVVVYLKKVDAGKDFPDSMKKCEVDNSKCSFAPHVAFVMKGGEVTFKNSDSKLHNIKAVSPNYNFNEGVDAGKSMSKKCERGPEEVKLSCSVHPWMSGQLWVVTHPYYAATNNKGEYEISDVPAGKYQLVVKHGKLGLADGVDKKGVDVEVKEGADTAMDFKYSKAD